MSGERGYRFLEPAALARVKNLTIAARGVVEGFIAGLHKSPFRGFSVEFAEHRDYVPGDNPRYLDWRTLGRTDRLYIKQYEEETNLRAQIVLDTSGSMHYGSEGSLTKFEYGAYLAAILSYLMTRQQDAVGLTTFDDEVHLDMPARTSPRHFGEMMRQLEGMYAAFRGSGKSPGPGTQIADTLHRLAQRFKKRCLVVLISDLYDEPESVYRALHHFRHCRHEVVLFHLLDDAELNLPFRDIYRMTDMETGEQLQIDPAFVRDDYCQRVREFVDGYRRSCRDCQIDYVMTNTSTPYDLMLSRYLATRSRL